MALHGAKTVPDSARRHYTAPDVTRRHSNCTKTVLDGITRRQKALDGARKALHGAKTALDGARTSLDGAWSALHSTRIARDGARTVPVLGCHCWCWCAGDGVLVRWCDGASATA